MRDSERRELIVRAKSDGDEYIVVEVSDTGPVISEEIAERLFQPFVTSKQSGMGIGLSLCRTIVESHGGRIWFESKAAGGTAFRFTIPTAGVDE
jgi:two-component system sensor kinase FixL